MPILKNTDNPMGTKGFAFVEFCSPDPHQLSQQFHQLGFQHTAQHRTKAIDLYEQGNILFFLNHEQGSALQFANQHGPGACSMGFLVEDAAHSCAHAKTLNMAFASPQCGQLSEQFPALIGVGGSLIYLVDDGLLKNYLQTDFETATSKDSVKSAGLTVIDHLTHNLERGDLEQWSDYYRTNFNFQQIRYFEIRGSHTGLVSRAMASPEGAIRIPLNEGTEEASQIEEFLREFHGPGIQHIALFSEDIHRSVETLRSNGIEFLSIPSTYYEAVVNRVPWHNEDLARLQNNEILIDGDDHPGKGCLLQIFTQTMLGPVFFEIIQRKGNEGFGEGNFQALFEAIEQDQIKRGVL